MTDERQRTRDGVDGRRLPLERAKPRLAHTPPPIADGSGDSYTLSGQSLAEGRFEVVRRLGEGGAGVVYEAHDRARGERVALKTLARLSPVNIYRLKQEFRSLADVVHPNLIGLHELFCQDELWFFSMDLVRGRDFLSYVRPGEGEGRRGVRDADPEARTLPRSPPAPEQLRDALRQLAEGVCAIHRAGKLHRDLKPSNILVSDGGQVSILDFGLAIEADTHSPTRTHETGLFGTPDYLSPERIQGSPATAASDWYAVGVVLHEALTGQLPFAGDRFAALRERGTSAPRPPHETEPTLPKDLSELCVRLLSPQPEARPSGEELLRALGGAVLPRREPAHADTEPVLRLVGRERELDELHAALREAEQGHPVVVTLPGLSGMGKSALMTTFAAQVRSDARAVILAGRCYERESVPYKTLDSVIDQLARFWRKLPATDAAALLPRDAFSLVKVFPVLSRVDAIARAPQRDLVVRDPHELRRRAFRALRELMGRISDRYTLLLIIDDLQWGDLESAREIITLLAPPDPPGLLALCAYRSNEVQPGGALAEFLHMLAEGRATYREVPVPPLSAKAASELVAELAPDEGDRRLLSDIVRESEGSPFFVGELVRQREHVARDEPLRLADVVRTRLNQLDAGERSLLDLLVVAPGPVKQDVLREASGLRAGFSSALKSLLAESLVRTRGGRAFDLVEPFHDRIREAVGDGLSAESRQRAHQAFADVWLGRGDADAETLGAHLEGCGHLARAAAYYEKAAQQALDALAFDHAASLYRHALDIGSYDGRTLASVQAHLAEALAFAGRGPESADAYQAAARLAPSARRNELHLRAAEQWLYAGHHEPALALLAQVLPSLGLRLPTSRWRLVSSIVMDSMKLSRKRPARLLAGAAQDHEAASRAELCATLGDAVLYVDFALFAYFQQQHVLHGLASGEPGRVAEALTTRALLTASPAPHKFDTVLDDLELANELAQGVRDPASRGRVTVNRAIVYSAAGHYGETEALAREAEAIFRDECQGVKWGLQLSVLWQSVALFYLGRFVDLGALCGPHLADAQARGDRMLSKMLAVWTAWAELAAGNPQRALQSTPEISEQSFTILDSGVVTQRGPLLLYLGRTEEAWELFQKVADHVKSSGVLRARTRAYEFHWTRGLAAAHLLRQSDSAEVRRSLESDIRELAKSKTADALAMARHLRGAQQASLDDFEGAAEHWRAAAEGYAVHKMAAFSATLRLGAERILGQASSSGAHSAEATLTTLGVRELPAWLSLWCPGWQVA